MVCHAPGALREAKATNGDPLVKGKSATGFSNAEEAAIGLTKVVPFLVEEALKSNGAHYSKTECWRPHVVVDGNLITGQNPASSAGVAHTPCWTSCALRAHRRDPHISTSRGSAVRFAVHPELGRCCGSGW